MAAALSPNEVLARACLKKAHEQLGSGWNHVSLALRWGLVAEEIWSGLEAQDESISAERALRKAKEIRRIARELFDEAEGISAERALRKAKEIRIARELFDEANNPAVVPAPTTPQAATPRRKSR